MVIRPETVTGQRWMNSSRFAGSMPPFPSSPERLTSTSTSVLAPPWRPSCSSTESVATEWIRRTSGRIRLTLRLCRFPMKSQVKRSPHRSRFSSRSWRRFSPTNSTPASASAPMSSARMYLVAARTSISGPACSRVRSRLERTCTVSRSVTGSITSIHPDQPGLPAGAPAVAAVGIEEIGVAFGAEAGYLGGLHTGLLQQGPGHGGQVEHPPVPDAIEVGELGENLVPDLVAAGADSRTDRGGLRVDRRGRPGDDSGGEAAPPAVGHRHASGAVEGNGKAVRHHHQRRQPGVCRRMGIDLVGALHHVGVDARLLAL